MNRIEENMRSSPIHPPDNHGIIRFRTIQEYPVAYYCNPSIVRPEISQNQ